MIPCEFNKPAADGTERVENALDQALQETFPASDAINLHQWNEMEAVEKMRAEREARLKNASSIDRAARYSRGPTAFSA
ncbi:MAG: hypothetical protein K0S56_2048 [Microvirga sp.]|jgi:hypothetical protein|nr:hypothetical protein [Microvirga sp.]